MNSTASQCRRGTSYHVSPKSLETKSRFEIIRLNSLRPTIRAAQQAHPCYYVIMYVHTKMPRRKLSRIIRTSVFKP